MTTKAERAACDRSFRVHLYALQEERRIMPLPEAEFRRRLAELHDTFYPNQPEEPNVPRG